MEVEGTEQNIILQPEGMIVGAVTSVNGQTGDVVLTTSDLENTSDYQTGEDVQEAIAGKQDKLTAGNNIQISEQNVISATNTTYSAGNGINISGENTISVDTTVVATQQNLSDEVTNRENADIYLQGQIDAISASSDVVDIVGTYAELQAYDTQHLKDNDIIKVLQDETQGNATTYYRWSTSTQTYTLIGQEGPYYTKAGADAQFVPQTRTVNGKALSSNITLDASDVSALGSSDVVQTTGSSTSQVMSQNAVTNELNNKLNVSDYVVDTQLADSDNPVQNRVLNGLLGDMPSDFFSGSATTTPTASTEVQFGNILGLDDAQLLGDTYQQTYSGKNLFNKVTATSGSYDYGLTANGEIRISKNWISNGRRYLMDSYSLPAGTYTISFDVVETGGTTVRLSVRDASTSTDIVNESIAMAVGDRITKTFTTQTNYTSVQLCIMKNGEGDGGYFVFNNVQLEAGSATSYEPYTGGIPAPNPDYPQPIQVVTGEQTVTVTGKNLLDITTFENGYINSSGTVSGGGGTNAVFGFMPVLPETDYTVSVQNNSFAMAIAYYDSNKTLISRVTNDYVARTSRTFTTPQNCAYARAGFYAGSGAGQSVMESSLPQFEKGSSASSYYPYQGQQSYPISLGSIELCKIGDYQDYIYKSGDDWYMHKELSSISFDGSENWNYASGSSQPFRYTITNAGQLAQSQSTPPDVYSNYYTPYAWNNSASVNYGVTASTNSSSLNIICFRNVDITSLADWKTWLSTHNTIVYYALATPTDTKITDATLISELEALLNASTYDGETDFVITATGTNLPAPLQLTAVNANAKGIIYKLRA